MNTAELVSLQLELERSMRDKDDALAFQLIERLKRLNREKPTRRPTRTEAATP